jgi:hypothetical protein
VVAVDAVDHDHHVLADVVGPVVDGETHGVVGAVQSVLDVNGAHPLGFPFGHHETPCRSTGALQVVGPILGGCHPRGRSDEEQ